MIGESIEYQRTYPGNRSEMFLLRFMDCTCISIYFYK